MNPFHCRYAKGISVVLLAGAFVISSEIPLLASEQQQSSSSATQRRDDALPDAPQSQPAQSQAQESAQVPSGTAGAKAPTVKGAPVAQPSGAAVAPPRQHGHRSLLIKLGILAGAGIAVGTVVGLSQASPARPPGAAAARP
ncbi:MAG TPA: hypothetical protein VH350_09655 [Candidatus Sulfotelmatobacter sp.]|jgi:hypothetical protein|nr:hypothetical protein [Candidatus Sulfotelmatobacter sp.]